jgi:hypothetical protein
MGIQGIDMKYLTLVHSNGEQHGFIKQVANSVQGDGFTHMTPAAKEEAIRKKKEASRIVKAKYLNSRGSSERLTMPHCLGAGEPINFFHFIPNQCYDLPKGLVDDVNAKKLIARAGKCDENGENPLSKDTEETPLHQFVPVGF